MIRNPYKNAWLEINHEGESGNSAVHSKFQHCEIHRCRADGEAALTFSKTWFPIFAVLVSVSCFACCVIFGTRIFLLLLLLGTSESLNCMARSLHSLCLQFAGERVANLQHRALVRSWLQQVHFAQSVMTLMSLAGTQHHWGKFCRQLSTCSETPRPWACCRIEPLMRRAFCMLFQSKSVCLQSVRKALRSQTQCN